MRLSVLGVMAVSDVGDRGAVPRGLVARRVLAVLAAEANHSVRPERLADLVWHGDPPAASANSLQSHISRWRRVLGTDAITLGPGGYSLRAGPEQLDALEFESLTAGASELRAAGDVPGAATAYRAALQLWHGPAFADLADDPAVSVRSGQLERLRRLARSDLLELRVELHEHREVLPEITRLIGEDPLSEPLHRLAAIAHYRAGDHVAALEVLAGLRGRLRDELGIDPSPELATLEERILRQDRSLLGRAHAPSRPAPPAPAPEALAPQHERGETDFVGRRAELATIERALAATVAGSGRILLLAGDAGIGKTRLVDHALSTLPVASRFAVRWSRSYAEQLAPACAPWTEVLAALGADLPPADPPDIVAAVHRLSRDRPLALVLDDLHWADDDTIRAVELLSRDIAASPVLLMCLFRSGDVGPGHVLTRVVADLARRRVTTRLTLAGLDRVGVAAVAERRAGAVPDWVVDRLVTFTGGNPFWLQETLTALLSLGPLGTLRPEDPWPLPAGVRDLTWERVARLPEESVRVLRAAALGGAEVDTVQLMRALELPGAELEDALVPAVEASLLHRRRGAGGGLEFSHALVREAIADQMRGSERLHTHVRLGQALLERGGDLEAMTRAAHHFAEAAFLGPESAARAVSLDRQVAAKAASKGRHADAVTHLERALVAAGRGGQDAATMVELRLELAQALQHLGRLDEAAGAYEDAADAATDPDQLARAALGFEECSLHARRRRQGVADPSLRLLARALSVVPPDSPLRIQLTAAQSQALVFAGQVDRGREGGDHAVLSARANGAPEPLARSILLRIPQLDPDTQLEHRISLAEEARRAARRVGDPAAAADLELEACRLLVPDLMRAGRVEACHAVVDAMDSLAEYLGSNLYRWNIPMWRSALMLAAGRWEEARILVDRFRAAAESYGYHDGHRVHGLQLVLLHLGTGDPLAAREVLRRYDEDVDFEPWDVTRTMVAHACGDVADARARFVRLSARRFRLSAPFAAIQTFAACLLAEPCTAVGDPAAARVLSDLVAPACGQNVVLGAGAAMLGDPAYHLGILSQQLGDPVAASALLTSAARHDRDWGLLPAAERADQALATLNPEVRSDVR